MSRYWYIAAVILFAILAFAIVRAISLCRTSQDPERSWVSYLLLWPVILGADKSKRNGRVLTNREWLGWAVIGLLIAGGILVNSKF